MSIFHGFRRHILDAMTGGGDLNKNLFPKELRNAVPKEIQPGGFDPAKQWFGYDIKADPAHDAKVKNRQETADALAAYNQGAPVFRGAPGMPGGLPPQPGMPPQAGMSPGMPPQAGMAPPQAIPPQQGLLSSPQFQGPYNQEAMRLASGAAPQLGGMPQGVPQQGMPAFGAPNAGSSTLPPGVMPYDNPMKSFRLAGGMAGGYYK